MEIWPRDGTQGDWDQKGVWMKRLEYVGEGMRRLDGLWVLEWDWTLGSKDPCWAEPGDGIGLNRDQRTSVKCIWGNNSRWLGIWGVSTAEMTSAAHREELDLSKNEFSVLSVWYYGNISGWANSTVMVSGSQEPRELQLVSSVTESCPTLGCPTDCSPPGSSVPGILQARILDWVAMRSTRGSSWPRERICISCIARKFFTLWAPREQCRIPRFSPWIGMISWRREWLHTPVFLHGAFPWTEGLGRLTVHRLPRVRHDWVNVTFFLA